MFRGMRNRDMKVVVLTRNLNLGTNGWLGLRNGLHLGVSPLSKLEDNLEVFILVNEEDPLIWLWFY